MELSSTQTTSCHTHSHISEHSSKSSRWCLTPWNMAPTTWQSSTLLDESSPRECASGFFRIPSWKIEETSSATNSKWWKFCIPGWSSWPTIFPEVASGSAYLHYFLLTAFPTTLHETCTARKAEYSFFRALNWLQGRWLWSKFRLWLLKLVKRKLISWPKIEFPSIYSPRFS